MARKDSASRKRWTNARKAENRYGVNLRKVAGKIAHIIDVMTAGPPSSQKPLEEALKAYADIITPWARAVAGRMLAEVSLRDAKAFMEHSREMGGLLRLEMQGAPTGAIMQELQGLQVNLIRSLPLQAAEQVHQYTQKALYEGMRYSSLIDQIQGLGNITRSRATLIARTEVGRASTNMTQGRALYAGSTGYIWRTTRDADVRPSHKKMEGKFVLWSDPPTLDGMTGHAGTLPNCRCHVEPIFPEDD